MQAKIIKEKISKEELAELLRDNHKTMVKVDVDVKRGIISAGGEWHSEGQELLVLDGSSGLDVWGCNFYPQKPAEIRIQYGSHINVKPELGNKNLDVQDLTVREKMIEIIEKLLLARDEIL